MFTGRTACTRTMPSRSENLDEVVSRTSRARVSAAGEGRCRVELIESERPKQLGRHERSDRSLNRIAPSGALHDLAPLARTRSAADRNDLARRCFRSA